MPDLLERLARAHQSSQNRLADAIARLVGRQYAASIRRLDDQQVAAWIAQVLPQIVAYRARSGALSGEFYRQARVLGGVGTVGMPALTSTPIDVEAVTTSLRVTGLSHAIDALERGETFESALKVGQTAVQGAAMRHTLDGGRTLLGSSWALDPVRVGAYRITQVGCCYFCAMLASRGAVYASDSFDASDPRFVGELSDVKVHDNDRCTLGFVYGESAPPAFNGQMGDLWRAVNYDDSGALIHFGQDAINAFRRAYEAQQRT